MLSEVLPVPSSHHSLRPSETSLRYNPLEYNECGDEDDRCDGDADYKDIKHTLRRIPSDR